MDKAFFFNDYYNNAKVNSILIMDKQGYIIETNKAFTKNFDYSSAELEGKNFKELFTVVDRQFRLPEVELKTVLATGQANDEGFIVNKAGQALWCSGEALLVSDEFGEKFIVKDVVNLHSMQQLNLFINSGDDFIERVLFSSKDLAVMILDSRMKIQNVNTVFLRLFEIETPVHGQNLSRLDNSFWSSIEMRQAISKTIVTNIPLHRHQVTYTTKQNEQKLLHIGSKHIASQDGSGQKIFIVVEEIIDMPLD